MAVHQEEEEDESIDNNINNNNINQNKNYSYQNNNINNIQNNINFNDVSRNPNLNNYNKNKKLFIPENVMNLVSFINSQTNFAKNSIPAINILSKINNFHIGDNQNNINKIPYQINNNKEGEGILQNYEQILIYITII